MDDLGMHWCESERTALRENSLGLAWKQNSNKDDRQQQIWNDFCQKLVFLRP